MSNKVLLSFILIFVLALTGCSQTSNTSLTSNLEFLQRYKLDVKDNPTIFKVKVPSEWQVQLGKFPIGLYWGLANEYSKDVGLDLTRLKGKTVEAHVYELEDGLPGTGIQSKFNYPSNAILIVDKGQIAGAWLSFNTRNIGPSVEKRSLNEITGLGFDDWVQQKQYFITSGINDDLVDLKPTEVIDTFFEAINKGDKTRAYGCLSPENLLESLTMNLEPKHLYNDGFSQSNSLVENIIKGKPIAYRLLDPDTLVEINEIGDREKIEIEVKLEIEWKLSEFNTPSEKSIRFAILKKYDSGWKLNGLGTGP